MAISIHDVGELGFGAVIAGTKWWDNKRIKAGTLNATKVYKKASFWSYLAIGIPVTLFSVMGWMPRQGKWLENMSHFAIGYLPIFLLDTVDALKNTATTTQGNAAVAEANRILAQRRSANAQAQLTSGAGRTTGIPYGDVTNEIVTRRGV